VEGEKVREAVLVHHDDFTVDHGCRFPFNYANAGRVISVG
jgi:hypothetical protein